MTIYTQVRTGHSLLEEFPATMGQSLQTTAEEALIYSPTSSIRRMLEMKQAEDGGLVGDVKSGAASQWTLPSDDDTRTPPTPMVPAEVARQKIKDSGLELTVPDAGIREGALDILMERKRDEVRRRDILNRSTSGFGAGSARLGTALAASMLDPLNVASAFIPVVSAARNAAMMGKTASFAGRTGVRARVGAVEGTVGAAVVEPLIYAAASQEQADYDLYDSLLNIGFGTVLGGGLHAGFGAAADALSKGKHWSQARASADEDLPQILERVDPETREAALRTAVAQSVEGRAVDVEPIVQERIAGAAVKYEDQVFTGINHGEAYENAVRSLGFDPFEAGSGARGANIAERRDLNGFVTNTGRFVDRIDAMRIARDAEQATTQKVFSNVLLSHQLKPEEASRTADFDAATKADEQVKIVREDTDIADETLTEAVEEATVLAKSLGDDELVTRELADFDDLAKTANAYGKAVRAAGACQLRRGAA